jgi:hypothetical protein
MDCICRGIKRKLDGLLYDTLIDPIYDKYYNFKPEQVVDTKPVDPVAYQHFRQELLACFEEGEQ